MSVHTIEITQLAANWPQLLAAVESGDEVILTTQDVPQARVTPLAKRIPGLFPGDFQAAADFDDPLPEEFWFGESNQEHK